VFGWGVVRALFARIKKNVNGLGGKTKAEWTETFTESLQRLGEQNSGEGSQGRKFHGGQKTPNVGNPPRYVAFRGGGFLHLETKKRSKEAGWQARKKNGRKGFRHAKGGTARTTKSVGQRPPNQGKTGDGRPSWEPLGGGEGEEAEEVESLKWRCYNRTNKSRKMNIFFLKTGGPQKPLKITSTEVV